MDYNSLLDRAFKKIHISNKISDAKNIKVPSVDVGLLGTKKTLWTNFNLIYKIISREPQHMLLYYSTELSTDCTFDSDMNMIIKGRFKAKNISNILKKYMNEYVICKTCKKNNTTLDKKIMTCNICESARMVQNISKGYHATTRADRKQMKK